MRKWWDRFKDVVYLVTIIGVACGWYVSLRITKIKNEMKDQAQDAKITEQEARIHELEFENKKIKGYAKENADNIIWLIRIWELDAGTP